MTRRRTGAALLGVLLSLLVLIGSPQPASGVDAMAVGWWWRVQNVTGATLPSPPTVPEGGILVAGAPDGPTAIAALRYLLDPDSGAPELTLQVASEQAVTGAAIKACAVTSGWNAISAGRWTEAPTYDCASSVTGVRSADGASWAFPLAQFVEADGYLEVVLVPGVAPGMPSGFDTSTFNISFERPDAAALAVGLVDAAPVDSIGSPTAGTGAGVSLNTSGGPAGFDFSGAVPGAAGIVGPTPTRPVGGARPGESAATGVPGSAAAQPASLASDSGDRGRFVAFLVLALAFGAAVMAGSTDDEESTVAGGLGRFRRARLAPAGGPADDAEVGGLGRFARTRTGSAPPLR